MTEIELIEVEDLLQANYQFLDFSNETLHGLWFEMLEKYDFREVRAGVKQYIENESKTPTINDVLEYIRPIRKQAIEDREHNLQVLWANSVTCPKCNDNGYIMIQYPNGDEAARPCDCQIGHHRFGEKYWKDRENYEMPDWRKRILFNVNEKENPEREMNRYKVVTEKPFQGKGVIWEKYVLKEG